MSDETLRDAARSLLTGKFLDDADAGDVRRARRQLTDLFRDELGWQVSADDHGPVRALCTPGAGHVARGLITRSGRRFDPARYALLFLVFSALEAAGARTTLRVLFEAVCARAADTDGLAFDPDQAASRRAYVHAVQAAVDLGVLELAEGAEDDFVAQGEGDALYRVERDRLTRMLATSKPPSLSADPGAAIAENLYTATEEGQRRQRRHRITRALVAEPVLYRDDLTQAEIDYITSQEDRLRRLLANSFGLDLETRAEGWAAVDPAKQLNDERFPDITVARAAALAVLDASRARRDSTGTATWGSDDLTGFLADLGTRFGTSWTIDADDTDALAKLAGDVTAVLAAMRLADTTADGLRILPAAGRFALTASEASAPVQSLLPVPENT